MNISAVSSSFYSDREFLILNSSGTCFTFIDFIQVQCQVFFSFECWQSDFVVRERHLQPIEDHLRLISVILTFYLCVHVRVLNASVWLLK